MVAYREHVTHSHAPMVTRFRALQGQKHDHTGPLYVKYTMENPLIFLRNAHCQ